MIECMILGDSIAKGIAQHRTECVAYAVNGITSRDFVKRYSHLELKARTVVISLGSNDSENMATLKELFALRSMVRAERIIWVLPAKSRTKREATEIVADKSEDQVVAIPSLSPDGVHPTVRAYRHLADFTVPRTTNK